MITVHHLNNSRSQRVLWLLEEMGLEYQIRYYQRDKKTMLAPPELDAVHPLGKSPVITDGDITVAETGAIIEYLIDTYGENSNIPLRPQRNSKEWRQFNYWLHYAEGSIMPLMVMTLIFNRIEQAPLPFFVKPIAKQIVAKVRQGYLGPNTEKHFDFIEAAKARGALNSRPHLLDYLERIHQRSAYKRALEKGGTYYLSGC